MTEPIKIGNVSFYKDDVKSSKVIYQNGEKINCVWLKDGTKIEFKDQDPKADAEVKTGYYAGENYGPYGTGFEGIKGLHIEGTDKDDFYHLSHCEDYDVNVENGGNDRVRIFASQKGRITSDNNDKVEFADNTGWINMNEGFFIRKD